MNDSPIELLHVEDNAGDVFLLQRAFQQCNPKYKIHVVSDGQEALAFLRQEDAYEKAPRPKFILLDLNLPRLSGLEVVRTIKKDPELKTIPVVVMTGSTNRDDILKAYDAGANCYVTKPFDVKELAALASALEGFWIKTASLPH